MKLPVSLVLPLLVGAVQAASETAKVYIFQESRYPTSSNTPTLIPEEARLVIAQRLGVSRYHSLGDVSNDALLHINAFGGPQTQLFPDDCPPGRPQVVVMIDNATPEVTARYRKEWPTVQPAFEISHPPSRTANLQFIGDLHKQNPSMEVDHSCDDPFGQRNPFHEGCWEGRAKLFHFEALSSEADMTSTLKSIAAMRSYANSEAMDVMVILMPESSRTSPHPYGLYDIPTRSHYARSAQIEEPIEELDTLPFKESNVFSLADEKKKKNATVKYSTCYSTNHTCQSATNNCSGHGQCKRKYSSSDPDDSCWTCGCFPSINISKTASRTYWGGAACQKEDVSSPFWLLVGTTVVLMGIVSAGIGMLFSIGEEKLPSVIGAGVSGPKAR